MAHFVKIENGVVTDVIVVSDSDCGGGNFPESEPIGQQFIASIGLVGNYIQTSFNDNFRDQAGGIGDRYDDTTDTFISPEPPTA